LRRVEDDVGDGVWRANGWGCLPRQGDWAKAAEGSKAFGMVRREAGYSCYSPPVDNTGCKYVRADQMRGL
jgi:hypothetical protein